MGIEPTSSAWKADILADVLYPQLQEILYHSFVQMSSINLANGAKRKCPESFESTNDSGRLHAADGGRTRTLSPERDFKSLVSASLRQSRFSFVVSFDFSLRERFFLREREGFAFFDKIILPPFSLHVNHVKLFHLVVLDLRSVRDPGLPPGAFALPRCAPQGGGDKGSDDGLMGVLMDWLWQWVVLIFEEYF